MVSTSEPVGLVRMLTDGAFRHVTQAQEAMENRKLKEKSLALSKANAIVVELLNCLDFRRGGEIALSLESLYLFILQKITDANISNDPNQLDVVVKILGDLSMAWSAASSDSMLTS